MFRVLYAYGFLLLAASPLAAQFPAKWKQHDFSRPRPPVVVPGEQQLPVDPPADAIVLFDGTDLSKWRSPDSQPAEWIVKDGVMESVAGAGYLFSAQAFGDIQLHVEWASPAQVEGDSQGRGNSGVFLMGLYEIQVLDSYQNDTYPDGQASAIYGQYPPLVNACLPPGQWQAYDITFRRPRFYPDGSLAKPARISVLHNGVLVQDNVEPWGPTAWLEPLPYTPHADKLPLGLQDHGNPVRYRNIWLRELDEIPPPGPPSDTTIVYTMSTADLDKYVGRYETTEEYAGVVRREGDKLQADLNGRFADLIPVSKSEFALRWTGGKLVFELDDEGNPQTMSFHLGGEVRPAQQKVDGETLPEVATEPE